MEINWNNYDNYIFEKELKNFLPKNIIDCHTHVYKKEFSPCGKHNGGSSWTDLVAQEMTIENLYKTYREMLPSLNIKPVIFGGVLQNLAETNDYVYQCAKINNVPALFRTDYSMSSDFLEKSLKNSVFKGLKPYISGSPEYINSNELRIYDYLPAEHLEIANKNNWVIMLHIPRKDRLKDKVNIAQLLEIDKKYPNIKLIVAHVGRAYTIEDFGDAFNLLKQSKNLLFDFSANVLDAAIMEGIKTVGVKRMLFGSDMPISKMKMYRISERGIYYNVVPKGLYGNITNEPHMRESNSTQITSMLYEQLLAFKRSAIELRLKDSDIEDILYNNSFKIFELSKTI